MSGVSVTGVDTGRASDEEPPAGTAIIRPLRHVRAVRERSLQRFAGSAEAAASQLARAWAWALGESTTSPVTDRQTAVPPARPEIETEIAEADRRRLSGSRENRADAAATVLRWLIGDDDHVPVHGSNLGALVGGSGDVIRTRHQIAQVLHQATEAQQRVAVANQDLHLSPATHQHARQRVAYLQGVAATLAWVLGHCDEAPVSHARTSELTTKDLKKERVHAEDLIQQVMQPWAAVDQPPSDYGEGVKFSIGWLLGDTMVLPAASRS